MMGFASKSGTVVSP